ncbi:MAG TPA: ATP cone domain-containing protein [Methanomicrobiales archaeon]|nr:ATP cone domain-containing protein [Methanomicrobiales archaeon]
MDVVKMDGQREPFVKEKIAVSAMKAGAIPDEARAIADEVESGARDAMSTREIRDQVLRKLRDRNPQWEQNWLVYDRAVKRRTP